MRTHPPTAAPVPFPSLTLLTIVMAFTLTSGCSDWIMPEGFDGPIVGPPRERPEPVPQWEAAWELDLGPIQLDASSSVQAYGFRSEVDVPESPSPDANAFVDTSGLNADALVRWQTDPQSGDVGPAHAGILVEMGPYGCDWREAAAFAELGSESTPSSVGVGCKGAFGRRGIVVFARTDPGGPEADGEVLGEAVARLWAQGQGEVPPAGFEFRAFEREPVWHRSASVVGPPLQLAGSRDVARSSEITARIAGPDPVMVLVSVRAVGTWASGADASPPLEIALAEHEGPMLLTWDGALTPDVPYRVRGVLPPLSDPPLLDRVRRFHLVGASSAQSDGYAEIVWTLRLDVFGLGEEAPPDLVVALSSE